VKRKDDYAQQDTRKTNGGHDKSRENLGISLTKLAPLPDVYDDDWQPAGDVKSASARRASI